MPIRTETVAWTDTPTSDNRTIKHDAIQTDNPQLWVPVRRLPGNEMVGCCRSITIHGNEVRATLEITEDAEHLLETGDHVAVLDFYPSHGNRGQNSYSVIADAVPAEIVIADRETSPWKQHSKTENTTSN